MLNEGPMEPMEEGQSDGQSLPSGPVDSALGGDGDQAGDHADEAGSLQEQLSDKQSEAIIALVNEPTIARAAKLVGINERTLRRWLKEPAFRRAYQEARREAFSHAISLTQRYAPIAANTLVKVMTDAHTPPGVKVAAATTLLKFGREGIELDDLAQRVQQLEDASEATRRWQR